MNDNKEEETFIEVMKIANTSKNLSEFRIKLDMNGIVRPNLSKIEKKEAELLNELFASDDKTIQEFWKSDNFKPGEFTFKQYFNAKTKGQNTPLLLSLSPDTLEDGKPVTKISFLSRENRVQWYQATNDLEDVKNQLAGSMNVTPIIEDDTIKFILQYDKLDTIMRNI